MSRTAPNTPDPLSTRERRIIENFLGTLPLELTYSETLILAEQDVRAYRLSRLAARELGARLRARGAR